MYSCKESDCSKMAAGGRSVTVNFVSRNMGMSDDQLVATRDTNGSVSVYDTSAGKCRRSIRNFCDSRSSVNSR